MYGKLEKRARYANRRRASSTPLLDTHLNNCPSCYCTDFHPCVEDQILCWKSGRADNVENDLNDSIYVSKYTTAHDELALSRSAEGQSCVLLKMAN